MHVGSRETCEIAKVGQVEHLCFVLDGKGRASGKYMKRGGGV